MQQLKDSELLARLIYRAFIGPAQTGEEDGAISFPMALALHARVAAREMDVSETDTGGTEEFTDRKVRWIIGGGSGGGGNGGEAGGTFSSYILDSPEEDETEDEPAPAPARKKSKTGMRGLNGGKCTEEKREIYARLMAFCGSHGLGARRRIAEASGGKLSIANVQDMTDAKQVDIKKWREAARAMDRIEAAEMENEDVPDV